jgi:hypothetical protein
MASRVLIFFLVCAAISTLEAKFSQVVLGNKVENEFLCLEQQIVKGQKSPVSITVDENGRPKDLSVENQTLSSEHIEGRQSGASPFSSSNVKAQELFDALISQVTSYLCDNLPPTTGTKTTRTKRATGFDLLGALTTLSNNCPDGPRDFPTDPEDFLQFLMGLGASITNFKCTNTFTDLQSGLINPYSDNFYDFFVYIYMAKCNRVSLNLFPGFIINVN